MAKRRARRKFTAEYKAEVVQFVRTSGKSIGAIAKEVDPTEGSVREWAQRAMWTRPSTRTARSPTQERAEVARPRPELRRVGEERDILKRSHRPRQGPLTNDEFVTAMKNEHSNAAIARALGFARSGLYARRKRGPSAAPRGSARCRGGGRVQGAGGRYGSPRVVDDLRKLHAASSAAGAWPHCCAGNAWSRDRSGAS